MSLCGEKGKEKNTLSSSHVYEKIQMNSRKWDWVNKKTDFTSNRLIKYTVGHLVFLEIITMQFFIIKWIFNFTALAICVVSASVSSFCFIFIVHCLVSPLLKSYFLFVELKVDVDNIDEKEFPRMLDLEFLDCILEEGEMLYIPPKWWHYVRSLTASLSVSFWWSDEVNSPES